MFKRNKNAHPDSEPQQRNPESNLIATLYSAAQHRPDLCSRRLDREGHRDYSNYLTREPFVKIDRYSGNLEEGVTDLIIVGDTMLAVSREINRKKIGTGVTTNPVETVRVAVLPIGAHDNGRNSSRTLAEFRTSILTNPREDGVVTPFEDVHITREAVEAATGVKDSRISRSHATIRFSADGNFTIEDQGSTNGTQILNMSDFIPAQGLDDEGAMALMDLRDELTAHPNRWDARSAGALVVEGAQD